MDNQSLLQHNPLDNSGSFGQSNTADNSSNTVQQTRKDANISNLASSSSSLSSSVTKEKKHFNNGDTKDVHSYDKGEQDWGEPQELAGEIDTLSLLTPEERVTLKSYARKTDLRIILYSAIGFMLCMVDRTNIGSAKISGLEEDISLTDTTYSIALSIFYVSYLFMQVTSNVFLKMMGPSKWIPFLGTSWGIICMCQTAVKNAGGLIAVRLFLGACEAGLSPGIIYLISFWYPRQMAGQRMTAFLLSMAVASTFAGPLAAGLSSIPEKTGLRGWQWIFLIEGLITVLWGIGGLFVYKDYPEKAGIFTKDERNVIGKIMKMEKSLASQSKMTRKNITIGASDWKTWLWGSISFAGIFPINTNAIFAPSLIEDMGHKAVEAQVLTAVPSLCGAIVMVSGLFLPKLLKTQTMCKLVYSSLSLTGCLILIFVTKNYAKLIGLCLLTSGGCGNLAIDPGYYSSNTGGVIKRGITTGIIVCLGSFSGFAVSYCYPHRDAPRYLAGHS
ncbi:hypothetical protein H4219_004545 [Mycoemilia scoparia]|uniref:Major facilitator superfamily (MFS) profile domain-containing protein n=1 Tax=Mycoemilia scoparia TaxID=417184 RepID=A0A9W7ZXZ0_9FUNG|nr:hypothetical protein H4219_004545 [Mycoemilia scoparia]